MLSLFQTMEEDPSARPHTVWALALWVLWHLSQGPGGQSLLKASAGATQILPGGGLPPWGPSQLLCEAWSLVYFLHSCPGHQPHQPGVKASGK